MRILAVIDSFGLGGAETQLADMLSFLTEHRGHECVACSLLPVQRYEPHFSNRVRRVYLNKESRLSLPRLPFQIARLIRQQRPDIAYSRLPLANAMTRIATCIPGSQIRHAAGIDSVPEGYSMAYMWRHPGTRVFRWLERFADRIICNSAATAQAIRADGYSTHRVRIVPNGIDLARFHPPTGRPERERSQLVCVASLRPEKGVDRLVRILAPVLRKDRAMLTIVGEGPERGKVEDVMSELGVRDAVQLLGARQDVVPLLHESHLYVSAAYVEGFGISVAEAAATGMPAVCLNVPGGLREVVIDGVTGYLVSDDERFRECVTVLCSSPDLRERLGAAARTHIAKHFGIANVGTILEHALTA